MGEGQQDGDAVCSEAGAFGGGGGHVHEGGVLERPGAYGVERMIALGLVSLEFLCI